jgi:cell division protein FtsB
MVGGRDPLGEARRRGWWRVAAVVALTIGVLYLVHLANGAVALHRARDSEASLAAEVNSLETEVPAIATAVVTATSDAYAEDVARTSRNLAQPGDHLVVPVPAVTPTPSGGAPATGGGWLDRLGRWLRGD